MKESSVSAFARTAGWFACVAVALILGAGTLQAQATGKVEGRVRDQAGAPVASAQVRIVGTAFGAVANSQGYYFINNVPPGTYEFTATFVGYKPVGVSGLKISSGQTVTQDFALEQTAVEITTIEVTAAQNALVPRDEVASKQRLEGDFVDKLPVDRIGNVLALQPGVVASANGANLNIRGGRTDEAATYIDGVPVTGGNRGTAVSSRGGGGGLQNSTITVGTNAFEDASVTTGASSAEFGNAQSGIVNIQTKTGGSQFAGNVGYETDEPFGVNHSQGYNRVQGSLSGPVFKSLTFFVAGVLEGREAVDAGGFGAIDNPAYVTAGVDQIVSVGDPNDPLAARSDYAFPKFAIYRGNCDEFKASPNADIKKNYGVSCQGVREPYSPSSSYQLTGKLNYSFGNGSRISATALANQNQLRFVDATDILAPQLGVGQQLKSQVLIANWVQNLSKSAERALAIDLSFSYQQDRTIQGALTSSGERDSRDPFGGFMIKGMDFLFDFDNFPITNQLIRNIQTQSGRVTPLDANTNYFSQESYRTNPWGLSSKLYGVNIAYPAASSAPGDFARLRLAREQRYIGKANLDWQADRYNRLKIGGELTKYNIQQYNRLPGGDANLCFCDAYIEKPVRWNGFVEDRIDLGDVVVVGGVRYDYYDSKALRPFNADSGYFFPSIHTYPNFDPSDPTKFFKRDKSHDYISPHIQVSFPVTERTNFRLSYAHQVQAPDFSILYSGINTDVSTSNSNNLYGTDLDFGKSITFEFGVRHAFSEDMVLDVAAYNKDKISDVSARLVKAADASVSGAQVVGDYRYYTNADFGTVRGIDFRLDRRFGNLFNGTIAYTYQTAKSTGTDPNTYATFFSNLANVTGGDGAPPQATLTTSDNRPHNLAGSMALTFPNAWKSGTLSGKIFQNFGAFAIFRVASGTPYTVCPISTLNLDQNRAVRSGAVCDKGATGGNDINGARLPTFKQFDLRLTKGFLIGGLDLTAYADIRNLFNFKNVLQVFAGNGTTTNPIDFIRTFDNDSNSLAIEARANPGAYDASTGAVNLTGSLCTTWVAAGGSGSLTPAQPSCFGLQRAEQRFGNGDGIYTTAEQKRASRAFYQTQNGEYTFLGAPRRARLGLEISF